ncbi:hypothetical protein [Bradyrhizobium diversitatis]|uniref:Uncharacterized protein n=1 Tax=Bradyrhizobium diversitatis TaxID=2755406 RepID=A0ABS0PF99_9BRAD|nr:hypothetical protein [Bradyrhizobium diversitatis]MBH5391984.1 hypothetical protein [Bradyrhizobium diversitatis]
MKSPTAVRAKILLPTSELRLHMRSRRLGYASINSGLTYFGGEEVKPGSFQYQAYMTNAVIFASSAGEDRNGRWVETWNFTLTEKNSETMIACFSRVVNNLDLGEAKDAGKFGLLAVGELHRTPN